MASGIIRLGGDCSRFTGKPIRSGNLCRLSALGGGSRGFCCPAPLAAAGFPFCCPVGSEPRFCLIITQSVRIGLRSNRKSLVIVGTYGFERFNGSFRPGKNSAFEHTSILVQPHQERPLKAGFGGAAGYRPRVRCVYCTPQFITIAGRTRHDPYGRKVAPFQAAA